MIKREIKRIISRRGTEDTEKDLILMESLEAARWNRNPKGSPMDRHSA